jgi:heat shock protein HtpX
MGGTVRTVLLMGVLTGLLMVVGAAVGYFTGISMTYALSISLVIAFLLNIFMYAFADKWVLKLYHAKIVSEQEQPKLHKMVANLASSAGIPKPKVAIVPMDAPNAFATGRSPSHSVVAATTGALNLLDDDELEGVLAHELAHVKNRDMLINTLAAMIGAAIGYMTVMSYFSRGNRDRDGGAGMLALLAIVLVPFAVMLVRLSISRGREYGADEGGAQISKKPHNLASALRKLETAAKSKPLRQGNPSTSHLFIVNPFTGMKLISLFSTHPPVEERVKRLETMAETGKF